MNRLGILNWALGLALAPLLQGAIARTKAFAAGRKGPPLLQLYFDMARLLRKSAVYSRTTTWVFLAGPVGQAACAVAALGIVPLGGEAAPLAFPGDFIVCLYVLGLGRFLTMLAALDTGSSFEGMGASREAQFAALAEPALLLAMLALARLAGSATTSAIYARISPVLWTGASVSLTLTAVAIFVVLLAENCRIPFDDPNTHLELTMIHEVMALDHCGPDLALIEYGAAVKLWIFAALFAGIVAPVRTGTAWVDCAAALGAIAGAGVAVGLVESAMARLRLARVPQLLVSAGVCAGLAFLFLWAR